MGCKGVEKKCMKGSSGKTSTASRVQVRRRKGGKCVKRSLKGQNGKGVKAVPGSRRPGVSPTILYAMIVFLRRDVFFMLLCIFGIVMLFVMLFVMLRCNNLHGSAIMLT